MKLYVLINNKRASMFEMKNVYTLDEALKLYALFDMEQDIEAAHAEELRVEASRR